MKKDASILSMNLHLENQVRDNDTFKMDIESATFKHVVQCFIAFCVRFLLIRRSITDKYLNIFNEFCLKNN
jgi:hypothetical protein